MMLERSFTYEGVNGKTYTDTWGFNLTKADLLEIHMGTFVGLDVLMQRLIDAHDGKEIMAIIKEIIHKSVGRASADGKRFIRNDEIWEDFYQSEAYSQLFEELVLDADKAFDFIAHIIPREMGEKLMLEKAAQQQEALNNTADTDQTKAD